MYFRQYTTSNTPSTDSGVEEVPDEKKKLRGIGAAFGRLRRTAFHRNSVMMLLLLLLGGLLCVSYYRSIQWSQWRRGGLAPVSLHPAGDQADHPAPAIERVVTSRARVSSRNSAEHAEPNASVAVVVVARTEKLPTEHLTELSRLRSGPRFQVIVVAVSTLFGLAQMEEATRFFDYLRVGEGAMDLCNVTLIVLRSANDSLPTYGEMCSAGEKQASASVTHVLFLSEAHVPRDVHFLKRMLEPFSLSAAPAWGVQCAIVEGGGDGAAPVDGEPLRSGVIVDHGLELSETVNHMEAPLAAVRRLRGFSVRDARLRRATRVHLISPYCSMWDRSKYSLIGGFPLVPPAVSSDNVFTISCLVVSLRRSALESALILVSVASLQSDVGLLVLVHAGLDKIKSSKETLDRLAGFAKRERTLPPEQHRQITDEEERIVPATSLWDPKRRIRFLMNRLREAHASLSRLPHDIVWNAQWPGWELSMRAQESLGTVYAGTAIAEQTPVEKKKKGESSPHTAISMDSFPLTPDQVSRWSEVAMRSLRRPGETPARVIWDGDCCGCCGFSSEITHLLQPLSRKREVYTLLGPECFCQGYTAHTIDVLRRAHFSEGDYLSAVWQPKSITVWVSHTVMRYNKKLLKERPADYVVARSMYEFSRIGKNWVDGIADVNEVWVPAKFVATAFAISGVPKEKLVVIPEAVDTYFFDPDVQDAVPLPLEGAHAKRWIHYCNSDHSSVAASPRAFKFFSNFKWEPRKGWETLFEAYWRAFGSAANRRHRPTSLYVLTYRYLSKGEPADIHNITAIVDELTEFVSAKLHVESLAEFPHFCIITETITETELAGLYKSADAFVLPTRGEGWCLPAIEAMSMGLPTIATAWGGQTEFMTRDNSFLILPDAVEEPPEDNMYGFEVGKKWATPSMNHTAQLMQYVYSHPVHAKRVGERARRHVEEHFSEEAVAVLVDARLSAITHLVGPHRE